MPAGETFLARLSRLFTDGARGFLQQTDAKRELDLTTLHRDIQPVVLVGRAVTSDTQAFDSIISTGGRVLCDTINTPTTAWTTAGASFFTATTVVGDYFTLDSGIVAGNVPISMPTASPSNVQLWEALQVVYTATCDATVATRTPIPRVRTGMNSSVQATAVQDFIFAASLPSLTANEEGRVFVPRSPALVQLNDNGVITTGVTSPLPILFEAGTSVWNCALTNGVATDTHRMSVWCRRVA